MGRGAYTVAHNAAPKIYAHFCSHLDAVVHQDRAALASVPDVEAIETMLDAVFWASLRREEAYIPKISLAYLTPGESTHPLRLEKPLPLDPAALARVAPAVERPGLHLGVGNIDGQLMVWGVAHVIPKYCFVAEVAEPGLIVIKHHRGTTAAKFVNIAVLEGDRIKIVDERASTLPDCPTLLTSLLGFDVADSRRGSMNVLVQLAVSMRAHRRGGLLIVVPTDSTEWRESIVQPISYAVSPAFCELAALVRQPEEATAGQAWQEAFTRAVEEVAGLTAVDGATLMSSA